jgi:hypothetical protein
MLPYGESVDFPNVVEVELPAFSLFVIEISLMPQVSAAWLY